MSSSQLLDKSSCAQVKVKDYEFELCYGLEFMKVKCCGQEALLTHRDFENSLAIAGGLAIQLKNLMEPDSLGIIAEELGRAYDDLLKRLNVSLTGQEYTVCLSYVDGKCSGKKYLVWNWRGIFMREVDSFEGDLKYVDRPVSFVGVEKIEGVEFLGIKTKIRDRVFRVLTIQGDMITGNIDQIIEELERYSVPKPELRHFFTALDFPKVKGFYAVGPWVHNGELYFATESWYNPPWKKVREWKLPGEVSNEAKAEALKRILGTVRSYKRPEVATWILSFGVAANFAHWFRQTVGYFPHVIITGAKFSGKTTLTALIKYLFWGQDPGFPRPRSEPQLRPLVSQATLPATIEDWNDLGVENDRTREMLMFLHSTAQGFNPRSVRGNPEFAGDYLPISSLIADANYVQDVDIDSYDKVILVDLDKDSAINLGMAKERDALLRAELEKDYKVHTVLQALGYELIQIAWSKLKSANLATERLAILETAVQAGYEAWIELFRRYNVDLKPTVMGFEEFPAPVLKTVKFETEEDVQQAFDEFITRKILELRKDGVNTLTSKLNFFRFGFYFEENAEDGVPKLYCNDAFLSEFRLWLIKVKGMRSRSKSRLAKELGLSETSVSMEGNKQNALKKEGVRLSYYLTDETG